MRNKKVSLMLSLSLNVIMFLLLFYIACIKTDFYDRMLAKVGLSDYKIEDVRYLIEKRCLDGWTNTIKKMNISADVVFFGNSITYESDFQKIFPNMKIINLGCNRDDLDDLIRRSYMINSVRPRKVFVLGGINRLIDVSNDEFKDKYETLVDTIIKQNPEAEVYLQSLLPVNTEMELGSRYAGYIARIKEVNEIIYRISKERKLVFVDLYAVYQVNNSLPQKYTRDGLHLNPDAYHKWAELISPYLTY